MAKVIAAVWGKEKDSWSAPILKIILTFSEFKKQGTLDSSCSLFLLAIKQ